MCTFCYENVTATRDTPSGYKSEFLENSLYIKQVKFVSLITCVLALVYKHTTSSSSLLLIHFFLIFKDTMLRY